MSLFLEAGRRTRRETDRSGIRFLSPDAPSFELSGFCWRKRGGAFRRLPESLPAGTVPPLIDSLADYSSGGEVRFRSDSARILLRAELSAIHRIPRMAATGVMGFDLYCGEGSGQQFCGVVPSEEENSCFCAEIFHADQRILRSFTLYFPLFAKVESLEIGVEEGSEVLPPLPRRHAEPVVAYGTSILQGACAGRPGLAYPARLSRLLERPVYNFGFAGNARGDTGTAHLLASLENPGAFLLDYDVNTTAESLNQTLPEFIRILRKRHPETPVFHLSSIAFPSDLLPGGRPSPRLAELIRVHRDVEKDFRRMGERNLHRIEGHRLLGAESAECSADGCHLNDAGFRLFSQRLAGKMADHLSGGGPGRGVCIPQDFPLFSR